MGNNVTFWEGYVYNMRKQEYLPSISNYFFYLQPTYGLFITNATCANSKFREIEKNMREFAVTSTKKISQRFKGLS